MKHYLKEILKWLLISSLKASNRERKEQILKKELSQIVPDLTEQYSHFKINMDDIYAVEKTRGQHTFQVSIALKAIELLEGKKEINVADIGDSAGTHIQYLDALVKEKGANINSCSVNLDPVAIKKIKDRGLNAIHCRAEDLHTIENGFEADIFMSYQMVEHLINPIGFLYSIALNCKCKYFVITVPYVVRSRV